jgi:hypothetical protein
VRSVGASASTATGMWDDAPRSDFNGSAGPAGTRVSQHHVGFAGHAAEIADARELPIQSDRAQEGGARDVVIADVVDLESARSAVARQHVARVIAEEAAERYFLT